MYPKLLKNENVKNNAINQTQTNDVHIQKGLNIKNPQNKINQKNELNNHNHPDINTNDKNNLSRNTLLSNKLNDLKKEFLNLVKIKTEVTNIFKILSIKILKLKEIYNDFIKDNKDNLIVFGLDSFHFQSKLLDIEFDDMSRLFKAITNRMYCEYYKLYKIIIDYILTNNNSNIKVLESTKSNNFPKYKDLEPFKEYEFNIIKEIHENILLLLYSLQDLIIERENEIIIFDDKKNFGFNIGNFVNTHKYNLNIIIQNLYLYINYMDFFHKLHLKYLERFSTKLQLMYNQVNNDIKFDDSVVSEKRRSMMETLKNENIDNKILKNIKQSIVTKNAINPNDDLDNLSLNSTPESPSTSNNNLNILNVNKFSSNRDLNNMNSTIHLKINENNIEKKIKDNTEKINNDDNLHNDNSLLENTSDKEDDEILNIEEIYNKENDYYTTDIQLNNDEFLRKPTTVSNLSEINISSIGEDKEYVNDKQESDVSSISGDDNNYEDNGKNNNTNNNQ
jgi:hypothetical protein